MGYSLVITEKPNAAKRLANALAESEIVVKEKRETEYYVIERDGKQLIIVPAVGHLFTLKQRGKGWTYPIFDVGWLESYKANKSSRFSKKYLFNIKDLAKDALDFIVATDYDTEGRVIAYNILRFLCETETGKSMRFSTLTTSDLQDAYQNISERLEWGMIHSGITRHFLDYYYGVNVTRALTLALNKKAKLGFQILSAGRIQAPTLNLLLKREKQIRDFVPTPYWQIELQVEFQGKRISAHHVKDKLWDKREAQDIIAKCKGKTPKVAKISRRKYKKKPPTPFNLTDLQTEAFRFFRYTPDRTLDIAQNLYAQGYTSYPRTSSQKLPSKINYRRILKALAQVRRYKKLATELLDKTDLKPREGKKKDPAHIAIYPTHEPPKKSLKGPQGKVYDLICRRFFATFAAPAVRETMKVIIAVKNEEFRTHGRRTIEENWYHYYGPYAVFEEILLPPLNEGDELGFKEIILLDKATKPPARYTPASLVKTLEERALGTRATRSQIIKTLFDRKYLKGTSIQVTQLGETVVDILKEYCPPIVSEKLTKEFEQQMARVYDGTIDKEEVMQKARQLLTEIFRTFKKKEDEIGEKLKTAFQKAQRADSYIGECPQCGNALRIIYSRKTHLRFAGCEGYFKGVCSFSSPLPQRARIESTTMKCKYCEYPMVMVFSKGRNRPWFLCLNNKCPNKTANK